MVNFNELYSVIGMYIENDQMLLCKNFIFMIDLQMVFLQEMLNDFKVLCYNGVYGLNVFVDFYYLEKVQQLIIGGMQIDICDFLFLSFGFVCLVNIQYYNGIYFDVIDLENCDNEQIVGSVLFFQLSECFGSYDFKIGGESFISINVGGNSQLFIGLVFFFDYEINFDGLLQFDVDG